jgi:hypothetical protein
MGGNWQTESHGQGLNLKYSENYLSPVLLATVYACIDRYVTDKFGCKGRQVLDHYGLCSPWESRELR